jgi:hypothetical protein
VNSMVAAGLAPVAPIQPIVSDIGFANSTATSRSEVGRSRQTSTLEFVESVIWWSSMS